MTQSQAKRGCLGSSDTAARSSLLVGRRGRWMLVDLLLVSLASGALYHLWVKSPAARSLPETPPPTLAVGRRLSLPGVDRGGAKRHVILRLNSDCPASVASIPFFRQVSSISREDLRWQVTVVTTEPERLVRAWLKKNAIEVDRVTQLDRPDRIGFTAIPTALLTDPGGVVTDLAIGKPSHQTVRQFLDRLGGGSTPPRTEDGMFPEEITENRLQEYLDNDAAVVLDVRDREGYAASHQPGSLNIPRRELTIRAPFELAGASRIVLDCRKLEVTPCRAAAVELAKALGIRCSILR